MKPGLCMLVHYSQVILHSLLEEPVGLVTFYNGVAISNRCATGIFKTYNTSLVGAVASFPLDCQIKK